MLINSCRNYYALKLFKSLINLNKKEIFLQSIINYHCPKINTTFFFQCMCTVARNIIIVEHKPSMDI